MASALQFLFILISFANGAIKIWNKNTNFDDPANWDGDGILCSNDKRVFAKELQASVFMQQNQTLQELRLSDNMILVLDEGVSLSFEFKPVGLGNTNAVISSSNQPQACTISGRELRFQPTASVWFNPTSWTLGRPSTQNDSQRFTLDSEVVPCSTDTALFPEKNSFMVDMLGQDLEVGVLDVHGQKLTTDEDLQKYWARKEADFEFFNHTSRGVVHGICDEISGNCQCSNNSTMKLICSYVTCDSVVKEQCDQPLHLFETQCCPLCGVLVSMQSNTSALLKDLHATVNSILSAYRSVQYAINRMSSGLTQIVLRDSSYGQEANRVSCHLLAELQSPGIQRKFNTDHVTAQWSDKRFSCSTPATAASLGAKGEFTYIVIGVSMAILVVIVVLVVIGVFIYKRKFRGNFKNEMDMVRFSGNRITIQGFDNPVYNTPLPYDDQFVITYDSGTQQVGFENPIYSPGADSGVSVGSAETKFPIHNVKVTSTTVKDTSEKKRKLSETKKRGKMNTGFENPVYAMNTSDMVSVDLEDNQADTGHHPARVQHDGTGFVNPMITSSAIDSAEQLPKANRKTGKSNGHVTEGIENPMFGQELSEEITAIANDSTPDEVIPAQEKEKKPSKKAKSGNSKKYERMKEEPTNDRGFGNPLYQEEMENPNFYQPETPEGLLPTLEGVDGDSQITVNGKVRAGSEA